MNRKTILAILLIVIVVIIAFFLYLEKEGGKVNQKPVIQILFPSDYSTVSKIVTISGTANNPDGRNDLLENEIMINDEWILVQGTTNWSYEWKTFDVSDGSYTVKVRSWDGQNYSEVAQIRLRVDNPEIVKRDSHKWAIFISASNFPLENESKLGNGALNLSEKMVDYFIGNLGYSTSNIFILFDDGWIRKDNGFGKPVETLDQRKHKYDISYGAATIDTVSSCLKYIIKEANMFDDSEIFIWISGHGCGDIDKKVFGGKILDRSEIFLWGEKTLNDKELGDILSSLKSKKTCIIVDACYSGGFADKTIYNLPEFFTLKCEIPASGRVVITGTSKFRVGYASTTEGPLFSQIWFNGITSKEADGFRPSILNLGRPTILKLFRDGKISVEEAFYYTRYLLRTQNTLEDYSKMEPQINDQYPRSGLIGSIKGLILGE